MKELLSEGMPELAAQWSDRNELPPEKYTLGSSKKVWWVGFCGHEWQALIKNRVNGSGCPYCTSKKILKGYNDLASKDPELAAEWSDRNLPLSPEMVMCKANKSVWWKGSCGHEWCAKIADRYEGHGCPYCAGAILEGFNDLTATRPALIDEWSDRNEIRPTTVSEYSKQVIWWKCRDCGFEWRARISTRCNGGGECPDCRKEMSKQLYYDMLDRRKQARTDRRMFMKNHFLQYLNNEGISCLVDHDPDIGIPISIIIPDKKLAIEFSTLRDNRTREYVKNNICKKTGLTMIRILAPGVEGYDNCFCITRKDKTGDTVSKILKKFSLIIGTKQG